MKYLMENGSVGDFTRRGILTSFREDARIQFKLTFLSPFVSTGIPLYASLTSETSGNAKAGRRFSCTVMCKRVSGGGGRGKSGEWL